MNPQLEHAWPQICDQLRSAVPEATYAMWLEPLRPLSFTGDTLILTGPEAVRRWAATRFGRVLQTCVAAVLGPSVTVDLADDTAGSVLGTASQRTGVGGQGRETAPADPAPAQDDCVPNPRLTFDQFVIGEANRFAHAAALSVAEMPGQSYNPLFIYGPPGLGKTHLLHSIANYVREYGDGLAVRLTTAEAFTNAFVASLRGGSADAFKQRFRDIDVLLVDDIQFLERKAKTEEEFFHTFNALHEAGCQLVLTSDRLPRDLDALDKRLRERFQAGLVTDVRSPDLPTRTTILCKRAARDGLQVAGGRAIDVIAQRITSNVRALEGALIRVEAFASLTGRPADGDLATEVLDSLYERARPARRSIEEVQRVTCEAFDISPEELLSTARASRLDWPRQVAMYLARELTNHSLPAIGRAFGGRDHTTVLHAHRRAKERMAADESAQELVRDLTDRLAVR